MRNNIFIVFIVAVMSSSCMSDSFSNYIDKLFLDDYKELFEKYDYIVLIPRSGCHACIEQADYFFEEYKDNEKYLFVFTKLVSEKQLRIELGSTNLLLKNVIVDTENNFYSPRFVELDYPLLLQKGSDEKLNYSYLN